MKKRHITIAVGTLLAVIGLAIPGRFPGIIFCAIGGSLLGPGLVGLILPEPR